MQSISRKGIECPPPHLNSKWCECSRAEGREREETEEPQHSTNQQLCLPSLRTLSPRIPTPEQAEKFPPAQRCRAATFWHCQSLMTHQGRISRRFNLPSKCTWNAPLCCQTPPKKLTLQLICCKKSSKAILQCHHGTPKPARDTGHHKSAEEKGSRVINKTAECFGTQNPKWMINFLLAVGPKLISHPRGAGKAQLLSADVPTQTGNYLENYARN